MMNGPVFKKGARMRVLALGALCSMTLLAVVPAAWASHTDKKKLTPLEKGMAFYQGKTITYIASTAAGSGSDIDSRAIAQEIGTYLHATVNVENISVANGVTGADTLAHANPNGLTIGYYNLGQEYENLLSNTPGLNFNIEREVLLAGQPVSGNMIATQSTSPLTSFSAVMHANPATLKFLIIAGVGQIDAQILFKMYHIAPDYISGYANSNALIQGFTRGDGNLVASSTSSVLPQLQAGTARGLVDMTASRIPAGAIYASVPTVAQLAKQFPLKTAAQRKDLTYFNIINSLSSDAPAAPSRTPVDEVDALRAAVKFAIHSAYYKSVLANKGSAWGYISGTDEKLSFINGLKDLNAIRGIIGS